MIAAGSSKMQAIVRYLKFRFRPGSKRFLFFFETRAIMASVPKLRAAASPIIRAGVQERREVINQLIENQVILAELRILI